MDNVNNFKKKYKGFNYALEYVMKHFDELKKDKKKWNSIVKNYKNKYEKPLDEAWELLTKEEKDRFKSLYEHRRESAEYQMERINRIVKLFNGKIISKIPRGI